MPNILTNYTLKRNKIRYYIQNQSCSPSLIRASSNRANHSEIVVKIAHVGKDISERFAHRYYNELTVGIDFTARNLQKELREKGMPWECCKGFDGSAALGKFINKEELGCDVQDIHFHMDLNGECRQTGHTADMIHTIDHIIAYASKFFTLKTGDLLFTGTPAGIGEVKEGDKIDAYIGDRKLLDLKIK